MTTIMQVEAMPTTMDWLAANERTFTMMVLLVMGVVVVSLLVTNEHTGKTMVLLITGVVAPTTMGQIVTDGHMEMWQVADRTAAGQLFLVQGTMMGIRIAEEDPKMGRVIMKLQLIGSICTVCVKHSNTTVKILSRTVLEICLILMETSMMHFFYE
jgi:hypothetical protein